MEEEKENQTTEEMVAGMNNPNVLFKYLIPGLTGLFVILCVVSFLIIRNLSVPKSQTPVKIARISPTTVPIPASENIIKKWVLHKIAGASDSAILTIYPGHIAQWKDWLFYVSPGDQMQILGYNLTTDKTVTILDQNNDEAGLKDTYDVSKIQVIGNTLYYSLGGYLKSGAIYWMNLPPTGKVIKLVDGRNQSIEYWHDKYWIIGGEGDACWGITDYSLFDVTSKKVTFITTSTSGCTDGEEMVDVDKHERMLMAGHNNVGFQTETQYYENTYDYVLAIPLNTPEVKTGIIAKQDMPKDVGKIEYLADKDQLLLTGRSVYIYDMATKRMIKTEIDFKAPTPTPRVQKDFSNMVNELKLPSGYKFEYE
jgi:hypothetical protein